MRVVDSPITQGSRQPPVAAPDGPAEPHRPPEAGPAGPRLATGGRRWSWWLVASVGLIVVATPLQRLRGSFPTERYFHSDIAFLPALFRDVARGGSLGSWGLPEAPYFVPDWPLYLVAWLIAPAYGSQLALFALLQMALLAVAWIAVARHLGPDPLLATVVGVGLLVAAGMAGQVPADYASVSFAHFGTFILTLAGLALYLRLRCGPADFGHPREPAARTPTQATATVAGQDRRLLAALFVVVGAATASDRLFLAWWVVPVVALEVLALAERHRPIAAHPAAGARPGPGRADEQPRPAPPASPLQVIGVVLGAAVTGLVVWSTVVRSSGHYQVEIDTERPLAERLRLVTSIFVGSDLTAQWRWYSIAVLTAALAGAWVWWRRRHHRPSLLVGLWLVLAGIATVTAELLTAGPGWRFHQFLYHVPILAVGLWLPGLLDRARLPVRPLAVGGALALVAWGALPLSQLSLDHEPPEVACLDRALARSGSRVGIGNYAASRLAVVHSAHELEVGTRNSWMAPEEDVHSRAWARDDADFAIVYPTIFGAMPTTTIRSLADRDPVETACGQWRILDFGPGGLDLDRLAVTGGRAEVAGCWYTGSIGAPDTTDTTDTTGGCSLRVGADEAGPDAPAYVGFGAYYAVGPGTYRLTAELGDGPVADGAFEVAVWDANSGDFHGVHATPLADGSIVVQVPPAGPELSLEGRILYRGGETLVLERMVIERVS